MHENREISTVPVLFRRVGQGRPVAYNPDMYTVEKSDSGVVPVKASNKNWATNCGDAGGKAVGQGKFWI